MLISVLLTSVFHNEFVYETKFAFSRDALAVKYFFHLFHIYLRENIFQPKLANFLSSIVSNPRHLL